MACWCMRGVLKVSKRFNLELGYIIPPALDLLIVRICGNYRFPVDAFGLVSNVSYFGVIRYDLAGVFRGIFGPKLIFGLLDAVKL